MSKTVEVRVVGNSGLFVKYSDGIAGEISLASILGDSEHPEFKDPDYLAKVAIDRESGDPFWPNGVSLCKNSIYRQLELKKLMNNLHIDLDKF
jgi:hypothetical protein